MIAVDVVYDDESMELKAPRDHVQDVLVHTFSLVGTTDGELSCTFVTDDAMRALNRTFRGKDESTDILSFVQSEDDDEFPFPSFEQEQSLMLGDMVISLEAMERNCAYFGVSSEEELVRLLVHGALHLLGWDHDSNEVTEPMLQKQEELVKMVMKESER